MKSRRFKAPSFNPSLISLLSGMDIIGVLPFSPGYASGNAVIFITPENRSQDFDSPLKKGVLFS